MFEVLNKVKKKKILTTSSSLFNLNSKYNIDIKFTKI